MVSEPNIEDHWRVTMQPNELKHWVDRFTKDSSPSAKASLVLCERFGIVPSDYVGKCVLDVGCGPTGRTAALAESYLIAIDPLLDAYLKLWPLRLAVYRETYSVPIEQSVPELLNKCDLVLCWNCLDHCYDQDAALANIRDYLTDDGFAIVSTDVAEKEAICDRLHNRQTAEQVEAAIAASDLWIERQDSGKAYPAPDSWMDGYTANTVAVHWWLRKGRRW